MHRHGYVEARGDCDMVAPAKPDASEAPRISVPAALLDQIVGYLAKRPFEEVYGLISRLQAEARPVVAEKAEGKAKGD